MVRILFMHPDLGIGGAERLVIDVALALQQKGHEVRFLTNHHDPSHCFGETRDGTLPVQVVGDWLPRTLFGRFYAFCAYMRMLYAAFYASFCLARSQPFDLVFCDQIPICIPVLRLALCRPRIIFYCHFPDLLLASRDSLLKRLYRAPIDWLEQRTIGMADTTLVNSKFTLRTFRETFRRLDATPVDVLYPSLNTRYFDDMQRQAQLEPQRLAFPGPLPQNAFVVLDINRYERKKNHALALQAFKLLEDMLPPQDWKRCRLVVAGGYDKQLPENVEHYEELRHLLDKLDLQYNAMLLQSPTDDEKFLLLHAANCLIYTPQHEHFGIVPLEAMYMAKPVIALNSGGPTETVVHNSTGYLCPPNDLASVARALLQLHGDERLRERMGAMGRMRVQQKFSFEAFANKVDEIVTETMRATAEKRKDA